MGRETAERVEQRFLVATERMRLMVSAQQILDVDDVIPADSTDSIVFPEFPAVRECNEALAAFGDAGDLLRSLRLFGKMRKLCYLQERLENKVNNQQQTISIQQLPLPSLVTYSTLMSRAVKLSKPRVALRLWNLMGQSSVAEEPDVKAANILMNCFAKMADVQSAKQLLKEMRAGKGNGQIWKYGATSPNLVTINTLLNACQNAEDLDTALEAKAELEGIKNLRGDARTYTTLIATVARETSQWSGKNDPSLAFSLLQEMQEKGVTPNGMTYSALIDACGRCRRSDLALQGLRIMLRQKSEEQKFLKSSVSVPLPNEVGAWTAAIDACGKAGRVETAIKLFYAMSPNFGCEPNTITCGCLMDSLLRAGRTAETLDVLRYMKDNAIEPSEVMYTSLMTRADRLVEMENNVSRPWKRSPSSSHSADSTSEDLEDTDNDPMGSDEASGTKAIEVYTELMLSLADKPLHSRKKSLLVPGGKNTIAKKEDRNTLLVKVFLVFQQMKVSGADPDIACYNALLRACARAGDLSRASAVIEELSQLEFLEPNDKTWREYLRVASKRADSQKAVEVWKQGLSFHCTSNSPGNGSSVRASRKVGEAVNRWVPSISSFYELVHAFVKEANLHYQAGKFHQHQRLLESIVQFYVEILRSQKQSDDEDPLGFSLLDRQLLVQDQRTMLLILQAIVSLRDVYCQQKDSSDMIARMEYMARAILQLKSFQDIRSQRLDWKSFQALEKAESFGREISFH